MRAAVLAATQLSGGFSPISLFAAGEQGGWYDPSDLSTMWQDSAGTTPAAVDSPVGKINDKSGNGNHLTQATSASRPMLRSDSGFYWLEFDGVDDWLDGGTGLGLGMGTQGLFCVVGARLGSGANQILAGRTLAGSQAGRWSVVKETTMKASLQDMAAVISEKTVTYSHTDDRILTGKFARPAGSLRLRIDAQTQSPDLTPTGETTDWTSTRRFTVGAIRNGTDAALFSGYRLSGRIHGIVVKRAASPDDVEIANTERWIAAKQGRTL